MKRRERITIRPTYAGLLTEIGFSGAWAFDDPRVIVWRKLKDRENCTADVKAADGRAVRLHIKRFPVKWAGTAEDEANGLEILEKAGIPCAPLVAWGIAADGRGFVITEDLAGFAPADKLIQGGLEFDRLLKPTAQLAANLHSAELHHRDLYLCHFFVRVDASAIDVRLIDAARVRKLAGWPRRKRWIVKDLAQFWYSTMQLKLPDETRREWLGEYSRMPATMDAVETLQPAIEAKVRSIAAHDKKLNQREPTRHVSLGEKGRGA